MQDLDHNMEQLTVAFYYFGAYSSGSEVNNQVESRQKYGWLLPYWGMGTTSEVDD